MPRILATASGFPPNYYEQPTITAALQDLWRPLGVNLDRVARLHEATTVEGRYMAVPREDYVEFKGWEGPNAAFQREATRLGEEVLSGLFERAGMSPSDVDLLIFASTTGLSVPPIDARLMNRLDFRSDLRRLPLYGLGCVAGAAGTSRLADYLRGSRSGVAVLLSIEFCSLTIQKQDVTAANQIACGLFGDGAGAVLMVGDEHPAALSDGPEVIDSAAVFFPDTEDYMGWRIRESGMEIVLSADVPSAARELRAPIEEMLARNEIGLSDVTRWVCHPGGPAVVDAIEAALDLEPDQLAASRAVLRRIGNVSSASVLILLDEVMRSNPPPPGSYGVMMAMGPGFVAEMVLLRW